MGRKNPLWEMSTAMRGGFAEMGLGLTNLTGSVDKGFGGLREDNKRVLTVLERIEKRLGNNRRH